MTYETYHRPPPFTLPPLLPLAVADVPRGAEAVTSADVLVRDKPPSKRVSFAPITVFTPAVAVQTGHSSNDDSMPDCQQHES